MEYTITNVILLFAVLLVIAVITTKFSSRLGLPSLVFFIAVGMALNHYIYFDNAYLAQLFGILALIVILFEGGLTTKWCHVRKVLVPSASLATVGVIVTTLIIGFFATYILELEWLEGLLFGAIVGSTDAAAIFAVLGNKNIRTKLKATLEAESGSNDPMAIFLTVSFISLIQSHEVNFLSLVLSFFWEMGIGLVLGLLWGKVAVWMINKINLDSSGLYPVLSLALAVLTYSTVSFVHASGLLAVYVMAIFVGNSDLTYRTSIIRFNEGFGWMMHILMFILLGLLVFPNQLVSIAWQGMALALLLMFVARPIGVFLSMMFMRYSFREKVFISWAGLRGAVPIVLATFPLIAGVEHSQVIFNVVFFVVFTSALFQGATISPLAQKLGFTGEKKPPAPHSLELVSIGRTNSEIVEITIEEGSAVVGKELRELELPEETLITAIIRGNKIVTPRGTTSLQAGDILYVLVTKAQRETAKQIILEG
ncbi:potassium/proton antiporter [Brevibacillus massiliensis]|uniref:potassium/proton antiporter n=1 Tax=Brevibacillus massiliensis TaxID=1118054 RepID=UPI0002E41F01|nr:potassium/proton antiporter [Brevibacillus massiliensis]